MITTFQGTLFDGETLAGLPVTLDLADGRIGSADGTTLPAVAASEVRVSDRLGSLPRFLYLPKGRTVETTDNHAVDVLLAGQRRGRLVALIHALETRARVAAAATLLLVVASAVTLWWGLPVLACRIAMAVPADLEAEEGRTALATFNQILAPSTLTQAERNRVLVQAKRLARAGDLEATPEIFFCSMGGPYPNAFALPGGLIVVSDELVRLTKVDDELAAVLAHEIGHWHYRHGTQSVLRGSTALLVVSSLTGDLSTLTTFAGTIPFQLLQRGYSREFEEQADAYAINLMLRAEIGVHHFASILRKLEATRPTRGNDFTYLSTHPSTEERIRQIEGHSPSPLPPGENAPSFSGYDATLLEERPVPSGVQADVEPQPLMRPAPKYPAAMKEAKVHGRVTIEFVIDVNGDVSEAVVVRSNRKDFEEPALAAVRQWKFIPGQLRGRAIPVRASQLLEFDVNDQTGSPPKPGSTESPD